MSIRVMSKVWEFSHAEATQLLLLLAIADYADDNGVAYPTIAQLARKCRQSTRSTSRQIAQLQEIGELAISMRRGRGNRNAYQVITQENMPKWHVLATGKHAISGKENMPSMAENMPHVAWSSISPVINNRHVNTPCFFSDADARKKKKKGVCVNSHSFTLPTIHEFTENYFDSSLETFLEENCPAVFPQRSTAEFIDYHRTEGTVFKSAAAMLKAWRGWMRNAQQRIEEKSAQRAQKENHNGINRPSHNVAESASVRNLRATVEAFGIPEPQAKGRDAIRAYAAKVVARKRSQGGESR